jgi:hypothetical protein
MEKTVRVYFAISMLGIAALACQAVTGGAPVDENPPFIYSTAPANEDEADIILSDDFSSKQWGTGTDTDSAVEYINGALNFIVFTENFFAWSTPNNAVYENIHMETTVINNGTDSTTAFGFICNMSSGSDFHYLAMTPSGRYAIAVAKEGEQDVFLTNNDQWADSDLIALNASSYRISADCGNGRLALYVDGQEIASANDTTHVQGQVAVFAWSGETPGMVTNVSFDDFVIKKLP